MINEPIESTFKWIKLIVLKFWSHHHVASNHAQSLNELIFVLINKASNKHDIYQRANKFTSNYTYMYMYLLCICCE